MSFILCFTAATVYYSLDPVSAEDHHLVCCGLCTHIILDAVNFVFKLESKQTVRGRQHDNRLLTFEKSRQSFLEYDLLFASFSMFRLPWTVERSVLTF